MEDDMTTMLQTIRTLFTAALRQIPGVFPVMPS